MARIGILLLLSLAPLAFADSTTDVEIDHILDAVAASDCVFIRNGTEHGPAAAKDHLNLKRKRGARYFSTAEEFIERLASSSSWTGKLYYIRCPGEEQQPAGEWLTRVLLEYRGAPG